MEKYLGYRCSLCAQEYGPQEVQYTCPKDGGNLDVILDYEHLRKTLQPEDITQQSEASLWRYLPLLPIADPGGQNTPLHAAGGTPVFAPARLAQGLGLDNLWVKDESRNPTASFKDRASAVVVGRAREIGAEVVSPPQPATPGLPWRVCRRPSGKKRSFLPPAPRHPPRWPNCWSSGRASC